jgi:hypothetical protein
MRQTGLHFILVGATVSFAISEVAVKEAPCRS